MKKFLPLLAVVAITAALIGVAVTRGFGGFSTAQSSGTCSGSVRQIAKCIEERCGDFLKQSPEYRECVTLSRGSKDRSAGARPNNYRRAAAPNRPTDR